MYGHDAISGFFFFFFSSCLLSELFPFKPQRWTSSAKGTVWKAFYFLFSSQIYSQIFFLLLNIIHPIEASEQESSSKTGQILDHRQTLMFVQRDAPCGRMRGERNHNRTRSLFFWSVWNQGYPADKEMTWQQQSFFLLFFFWANQPSLVMRHVAVL